MNALPRLPWAVQVNSTRKTAFFHLSYLHNRASESVLSLALCMYISSADILKCTCHRRADCTFQHPCTAHFYSQRPKPEPSSSSSLPIQHTLIYLPVIRPSDDDPHRQKRLRQPAPVGYAKVALRRIPGMGKSARGQAAFRERRCITGRIWDRPERTSLYASTFA